VQSKLHGQGVHRRGDVGEAVVAGAPQFGGELGQLLARRGKEPGRVLTCAAFEHMSSLGHGADTGKAFQR